MNVLLITFSFPPAGGVGVLRATSLAKYWPADDVRVDVLTARNAPAVGRDEALLKQIPSTVTVHRTWTLDLPFAVRKRLKALLFRGGAAKTQVAQAPTQRPSLLGRIKRVVANLLLPDPQIGWLPFAYPAARRIIRKRNIDVVVITVPPFSSVMLASKLRRSFPHLPIIVDFRDEWLTTTLDLVSFNNNERAKRIAQQTEADAVHAATRVVMVTENAVNEIRSRYPHLPSQKFLCVPNGFDGEQSAPAKRASTLHDGKVTLTYMGTVYGSTDPTSLIEALQQLPAETRDSLRIRFIGRIETDAYRRALESQPGVVEIIGFVPQREAIKMLSESDFALLITHDPINVSAKFYDYLGAGIPIVAAVHREGEVRRLMEATRAGWWADAADPAAIRQLLEDAVRGVREGTLAWGPDTSLIAQYHRRPLAHGYVQMLSSLKGDRV